MATRGQLKRRKENPGEATAAAATDTVRRGRNARNYKRRPDGGLTITVRGGANAAETPKPPPAPKAPSAAKKAAEPAKKAKTKAKNPNADWAAGERKRLKADKKAQSQVRASVGEQAGRRAAKRMDSPRGKLQARRRQAGENLRRLSAAIKPSKTGVESYKSFMGG